MAKTNKQINKEAGMTPSLEDTPVVIAYRMGQLENAVKDGFAAHDKKLEGLTNNFAPVDRVVDIERRLDSWIWYWRALVTAVFLALATAIGSLVARK